MPVDIQHVTNGDQLLLMPAAAVESVREFDIALELAGPNESFGGYWPEISYARRALAELYGCPPLADAARFPVKEQADRSRRFASDYHDYLSSRREVIRYRFDDFTEVMADAKKLLSIWEQVQVAVTPTNSCRSRRLAMAQLREQLGEEAYYTGRLPAPVPVQNFREIVPER